MNVPDQLFERSIREGFTKEAACALLANIQAESAFNPINLEDSKERLVGMTDQAYTDAVDSGRYQNFVDDACGYGLAQWTFWSRKQMLLQYAKEKGMSIGSLDMQKEFIFYEMKKSFAGIYSDCKSSHDLEYLVHKFLYQWENPAEKEENMKRRLAAAQGFYQKYAVWESGGEEKESMTKETAVQRVLTLARAEIGYHEKASYSGLEDKTANSGSGNYNKYASELDQTNWYNGAKNGYAWCDVFVDWLFYKAFGKDIGRQMICQPTKSAGAGCLYSAQYYKQAGRWVTSPEVGDQIFFTYAAGEYSHTGIVERVEGNVVTTIEGNTSDQVARRQYQLGSGTIAGYGRPKWELAGEENTVQTGNVSTLILQRGMTGWDVKNMQQKLLKLGFDLGPDGADGDFGPKTEEAVRAFQTKYSLEIDGIAGAETLGKLEELINGSSQQPAQTSHTGTKPVENQNGSETVIKVGVTKLKNGDKGNMVKLAQAALSCLGYSLTIDGIFGNEFENKVKAFQKADGLPVTGVVDRETWDMLLDIPFQESLQ